MNTTDFIDRTVQKTHIWLRELSEYTGRDDQHLAYQELRGVLHTLRDRLTVEEAASLAAQLPLLVRGMYYDGWRPSIQPVKMRSEDEFVQAVADKVSDNPQINPKEAINHVFRLLNHKISEGELDDVQRMLPEEIRRLWPHA